MIATANGNHAYRKVSFKTYEQCVLLRSVVWQKFYDVTEMLTASTKHLPI